MRWLDGWKKGKSPTTPAVHSSFFREMQLENRVVESASACARFCTDESEIISILIKHRSICKLRARVQQGESCVVINEIDKMFEVMNKQALPQTDKVDEQEEQQCGRTG